MNIEQMKCAVAVAACGSINKAAKDLFISQPRLSQSIKNIELELGYQVFNRGPQGIMPTPKGRLFLSHCETILLEFRKAQMLADEKSLRSFHLSAGSLYIFMDAFVRLCKDYQNDPVLDLKIFHENAGDVEESVYQGTSQLGILLLREDETASFIESATRKDLTAVPVRHIRNVLTVRKGHPVLQDDPLDLKKLYNYPFVDYINREISTLLSKKAGELVNPEKMILIEERDMRHMIVSRTNAFAIGCSLAKPLLEQYQLTAIPLDTPGFQIIAVYRSQTPLPEEAKKYLDYVEQVLRENDM